MLAQEYNLRRQENHVPRCSLELLVKLLPLADLSRHRRVFDPSTEFLRYLSPPDRRRRIDHGQTVAKHVSEHLTHLAPDL